MLEGAVQILNIPLLLFIVLLFRRFQELYEGKKRSYLSIIVIAALIALSYGSFAGGVVWYFLILELLVLVAKGMFGMSFLEGHFLLGRWAMYLLIIKNIMYCAAAVVVDRSVAWLGSSAQARRNISFLVYMAGCVVFVMLKQLYSKKRLLQLMENRIAVQILVLTEYSFSLVSALLLEFMLPDVHDNIVYLYYIMVMLIGSILYSVVFYMFVFFQEKEEAREQTLRLELLHQRSREYYEMELEDMHELRKARHDFRNRLFILRCMLEEGETEKAKEYLAEQEEYVEGMEKENLCNWGVLNYILVREKAFLEARGIRCRIALWIPEIRVKEEDLYLIFLNLLHNCREALIRQSPEEERYLEITGEEEDGKFVIRLVNSFSGEIRLNERQEIRSLKEDQENHGLGLNIIRSVLKKNGGAVEYRFDTKEKYFQTEMVFQEGDEDGN